jgi:site-specific DNA-methyltransferase (adenine-specific)
MTREINANAPHERKTRQAWATPPELFAKLHEEFRFTVDVCAGIENAKLPRFFDETQDGLKQSWDNERCFCNPPFGQIDKWLKKGIDEIAQATGEVFCCYLIPANTDTKWFHKYAILGQIEFFEGRVGFLPPAGVAPSTPSFPVMLVIFDSRAKAKPMTFKTRARR